MSETLFGASLKRKVMGKGKAQPPAKKAPKIGLKQLQRACR